MRYKTINVTCYKLDKHRSLLTTNSLTPPHQIGIQLVSMAIEIGIGIVIVIQKENDIRIVMHRTDMETDVIPIETAIPIETVIAIVIVIVIVYPIARCLIRRSMTIRCPVICPTHDPFPPMMTHPIDLMDMAMVGVAAAEGDDMATVAMTLVIHPGIHLAAILWVAIPAVMLQIAYSRTDDIVPHPWTPLAIPMRQTHGDHPDVMMISYTVPDAPSPSPPNVIHLPRLCLRAAPVNMLRPPIAFQ